eukprot:TRINITY_DN27071_c0_g1_i1.p1 TRINITY_DN27071_c0_g1~~TRINITY_DN27071_c0_g1_i1.p1  ORF type:complete len:309 (+),score=55.99 TRINITY_DN27071_c0_g1_i1:120-1046(+)
MAHGGGFQTPQEQLQSMKSQAAQQVSKEWFGDKSHSDVTSSHGTGTAIHVYGGEMSAKPKERQLVRAQRPNSFGKYELALGVIHRVHEDDTVTVQFVPDQHRLRLRTAEVQPLNPIEPNYPTVRLEPGKKMPSVQQCQAEEERLAAMDRARGLPPDHHLKVAEATNPDGLRQGEFEENGKVKVWAPHWGIPASTLDALKNRSIPAKQVTTTYNRHFYSDLYRTNFYYEQSQEALYEASRYDESYGVSQQYLEYGTDQTILEKAEAAEQEKINHRGGRHILVSHTYIPLEGPELEMNMVTGQWVPHYHH